MKARRFAARKHWRKHDVPLPRLPPMPEATHKRATASKCRLPMPSHCPCARQVVLVAPAVTPMALRVVVNGGAGMPGWHSEACEYSDQIGLRAVEKFAARWAIDKCRRCAKRTILLRLR
jgi:hypothetical protein